MIKKNTNAGFVSDKVILGGAVVLGIAIIVLAIVFGKGSGAPSDTTTAPTDGRTGLEVKQEQALGNPNASSTIVEFLDFQCSACVAFFSQVEPQIRAQFVDTGKAKWIAKTLSFIDGQNKKGESFNAARAAQCAAEQNGFWKMHDAIYSAESAELLAKKNNENSGNLTRDAFIGFAQKSGLDVGAFTTCYDSDKYMSTTSDYMKDAQAALNDQVATPSIFVNGVHLKNPFDLKEYEALIK